MHLPKSVAAVLREPSTATIWELRGELLAAGLDPEAKPFELLSEFHRFLDRIATGAASRDHSERASMMEVAALGGVVASDLAEAADPVDRARRLLAGVLTEGLAVLATRQHVKAWHGELASVYREAVWYLYGELWRWTSQRKPELDPAERRGLLDQLMAPIGDETFNAAQKTAILCALFQLLLVDVLAEAVGSNG
jgi:hypothetical protein